MLFMCVILVDGVCVCVCVCDDVKIGSKIIIKNVKLAVK